jgi:hypothetical protein
MQDKDGLQAGDYSFRMLVPFGTLAEVENTIKSIMEKVKE